MAVTLPIASITAGARIVIAPARRVAIRHRHARIILSATAGPPPNTTDAAGRSLASRVIAPRRAATAPLPMEILIRVIRQVPWHAGAFVRPYPRQQYAIKAVGVLHRLLQHIPTKLAALRHARIAPARMERPSHTTTARRIILLTNQRVFAPLKTENVLMGH